jgi:hypothetical protein
MSKTRESSSPTIPTPRVANHQPTQEEIALRAYQIYLERGGVQGNEFEDWMEAQRQLAGENGEATENRKAPENGKPRRKPRTKIAVA